MDRPGMTRKFFQHPARVRYPVKSQGRELRRRLGDYRHNAVRGYQPPDRIFAGVGRRTLLQDRRDGLGTYSAVIAYQSSSRRRTFVSRLK